MFHRTIRISVQRELCIQISCVSSVSVSAGGRCVSLRSAVVCAAGVSYGPYHFS